VESFVWLASLLRANPVTLKPRLCHWDQVLLLARKEIAPRPFEQLHAWLLFRNRRRYASEEKPRDVDILDAIAPEPGSFYVPGTDSFSLVDRATQLAIARAVLLRKI
jgi:hypothetical protein